MADFVGKKILICCNLKKERVLLFNYFDKYEAEMIYSEKNLAGCNKTLASEKIDCLLISSEYNLIQNSSQLQKLVETYKGLKLVLVINKETELDYTEYQKYSKIADVIFFEPFSGLEIETKLVNIFSTFKTQQNQLVTLEGNNNKENNGTELWDLFFFDCSQAKLIISAKEQKIIQVNDSLLSLVTIAKKELIGKSWTVLDDKASEQKYAKYIKEINSNEKLKFVISRKNTNKNFEAEYQLSVLNGEMVFIGRLNPVSAELISDIYYGNFLKAVNISINSNQFQNELASLRESLGLDFIVFSEYIGKKFTKPITSYADVNPEEFISKHYGLLLKELKVHGRLQVNIKSPQINEISDIFNNCMIKELYAYLIYDSKIIYGVLVAGSKNITADNKSNSIILQTLVQKSRFMLFKKRAVSQRVLEGQVDKLTGLPNRSSITKKFRQILEHGLSSKKYLSLMVVEIEKLSSLNKNLGLELTDEIIVNTSQIIVRTMKGKGQVYRLSGNEFVVLLHPHKEKAFVEEQVRNIVSKLNKPILLSNGEENDLSFNIGVSIFPDDGQTISSMIKNADLAMYDAKLAGENNYVIFKYSETGQALKQRVQMEENLKNALGQGHIKAYYQPKIDSVTEDIVGFEALVRWIDPELGMISPGHFIPLAEEVKLISPIGELVATQACKKLAEWQKKFGLSLSCSINLSLVQLMDNNLPKILENIVNKSGIHPRFIDFEITETINLDTVPNLVELLNEIVGIGCTLSIDDFGTGHSSLDYVKKIPAKYIKIDQSFVKNIGLNPEDEAILDATIAIAKRLNRKLIAEGVETEEQREYLLEREVEYFQGYLFATPMSEEKIEELLEQRVKLMGSN